MDNLQELDNLFQQTSIDEMIEEMRGEDSFADLLPEPETFH